MREVGELETSVLASAEPFVEPSRCAAERVAARLVGGLPSWDGSRSDRVARMTDALVRLQAADAASKAQPNGAKERG